MYMCMYMSVCGCIIGMCTLFDTIFPLRPIQTGCLDHNLSTALFPSQHTASRRKALSTVPSLRCFPITLLGLLAMLMVIGC